MTSELATTNSGAALLEQVVIKGDLSKLTDAQRVEYYSAVCRSLDLNPLTRPFEYITLNNKLTLYATRGCTDQLRSSRGITITGIDPRKVGDLFVVVATGRDRSGREDSSTGAVNVKGLMGENLANAMMKAETKAKRRLTLSIVGLGLSDESEIGSIPSAAPADVDPVTGEIRRPPTLAERVQERAAVVTSALGAAQPAIPPTDTAAPAPVAATPVAGVLCGVADPFAEPGSSGACSKTTGHSGAHGNETGVWPASKS